MAQIENILKGKMKSLSFPATGYHVPASEAVGAPLSGEILCSCIKSLCIITGFISPLKSPVITLYILFCSLLFFM